MAHKREYLWKSSDPDRLFERKFGWKSASTSMYLRSLAFLFYFTSAPFWIMRRILAGWQHHWKLYLALYNFYIFSIFFGGLEYVGHSIVYVAHFVFLRDVLIRTQRAAVASRRYQLSHSSPTNLAAHLSPLSHPSPSFKPPISLHLATHLPQPPISLNFATHLPQLNHPSPSS
jgi:hypothetical protein